MNRSLAIAVLGVAALLIAVVVLYGVRRARSGGEAKAADVPSPQDLALGEPEVRSEITLYFPGEEDRLYPETRPVEPTSDRVELATRVLNELLRGPESELLARPLPSEVEVGSVHFAEEGIVFVDFESDQSSTPPASGSTAELLSLHSLANSLAANVADVRSIVVLWNGRQLRTFAGHVDTSRPITPDTRLLAPPDRTPTRGLVPPSELSDDGELGSSEPTKPEAPA